MLVDRGRNAQTRDGTYGRGGVGLRPATGCGHSCSMKVLAVGIGAGCRAYVRKTPARNLIPDILDGRVVVGCDAPEQSVAVDFKRFREAYVRIVPAEPVTNPSFVPE